MTPEKEVLTLASPLMFRAVTEPLLFSTVRFPFTRSIKTLPKLVFAYVSPPISASVIAPFPSVALIPFGMLAASMAPKDVLRVTTPRASRTVILPFDVSASSVPLIVSNSMLPKES